MADGKTATTFHVNENGVELVIRRMPGGTALASCLFTFDEGVDFTAKLARALDEVARRENKPRLVIPGLEVTGNALTRSH